MRKETVESFRTSQQRVRSSYHCVEKDVYDKTHPGMREKRKLLVQPFFRGGKWVDCVMIAKQKHGEFEVDMEDIVGATHKQDYDSGDFEIRSNQAEEKFKALAAKQHLTNKELEGLASASGSGSSASEAEMEADTSQCGTQDSGLSEPEEDDLEWVTKSILSSGPVSKPAAKIIKSAKAGSAETAKARTVAAAPRTPARLTPSKAVSTQSSDDNVLRRKFRGKTADDILGPHGWEKLMESVEELKHEVTGGIFQTMLTGGGSRRYCLLMSKYCGDSLDCDLPQQDCLCVFGSVVSVSYIRGATNACNIF